MLGKLPPGSGERVFQGVFVGGVIAKCKRTRQAKSAPEKLFEENGEMCVWSV